MPKKKGVQSKPKEKVVAKKSTPSKKSVAKPKVVASPQTPPEPSPVVYDNATVLEIIEHNWIDGFHRCKMDNGTVVDVPANLFK